jgi:hypothetical protein
VTRVWTLDRCHWLWNKIQEPCYSKIPGSFPFERVFVVIAGLLNYSLLFPGPCGKQLRNSNPVCDHPLNDAAAYATFGSILAFVLNQMVTGTRMMAAMAAEVSQKLYQSFVATPFVVWVK